MLKKLIKLSNHLDSKGLTKEADYLDMIISKMAGSGGYEYEDWGEVRYFTIDQGGTAKYLAGENSSVTYMLNDSIYPNNCRMYRWIKICDKEESKDTLGCFEANQPKTEVVELPKPLPELFDSEGNLNKKKVCPEQEGVENLAEDRLESS